MNRVAALLTPKNKLVLEMNPNGVRIQEPLNLPGVTVAITPPIGEDFWLMRVRLSETQAIVGFPKFWTLGIGFQVETDWNTNLPYRCEVEEIYNHIKHNKGDKRITKANCMKAIAMIKEAAEQLAATDPNVFA